MEDRASCLFILSAHGLKGLFPLRSWIGCGAIHVFLYIFQRCTCFEVVWNDSGAFKLPKTNVTEDRASCAFSTSTPIAWIKRALPASFLNWLRSQTTKSCTSFEDVRVSMWFGNIRVRLGFPIPKSQRIERLAHSLRAWIKIAFPASFLNWLRCNSHILVNLSEKCVFRRVWNDLGPFGIPKMQPTEDRESCA